MDATNGKGDAHEAYPNDFCPHYPYASWERDREPDDEANLAYYFIKNLCAVGGRRANPHAKRSSAEKRRTTVTTFKSVCESGETIIGSEPYSGTQGVGFQQLSGGSYFQFRVGF